MTESDEPGPGSDSAKHPRNLETQLWHAVLDVHGTVFARLNRAMGREFGITLAKFDVLAQLYRSTEGMTQGNLSRHLKVTGGNVTGLVRRLTADGLITREMSASDRRVFVVQLTARGRELYLAVRSRHDAMLEDWFHGLGTDDKNQALRVLKAMSASVGANTPRETE